MDDEREYRGVDGSTFDRDVRYAFRPTAGPAEDGTDAGDGAPADDEADADGEADPAVQRSSASNADSTGRAARSRSRSRATTTSVPGSGERTTGSAASPSSPPLPNTAGRATSAN